jgi:hypothetical protein
MNDEEIAKLAMHIANGLLDGYADNFTTTDLQKAVDLIKGWYTSPWCSNFEHNECFDLGCHCDCGHSALKRSFE